MPEFLKYVKQKMVQKGRDDFTKYLAEILGISKQSASHRMTGRVKLSLDEISKLNSELDFDAGEIKKILERERCEGQ